MANVHVVSEWLRYARMYYDAKSIVEAIEALWQSES